MNGRILWVILTFLLFQNMGHAVIVVSDWNIIGNTLTFSISGEIDSGVTLGTNNPNSMMIGHTSNTDWVLSPGGAATITNLGGGANTLLSPVAGSYSSHPNGDFVGLSRSDFGNWAVGNSINADVQISGGLLDGGQIDPTDMIVSIGYNNFATLPDPITQVGYYTAIPESQTFGFFLGIVAIFGICRFRRLRENDGDEKAVS